MGFPSQQQIDVIATQILLDTKQALLQLRGWNNSITDGATKMRLFKELIKSTAVQMNGDFKAATAAVSKFAGALNVNPQSIRKLGKDLQTMDKIAQQSLGGMAQRTVEASARMSLLANAIQAMAVKSKQSIDQVTSSLRTLNASSGTRFGKLGFSDADIAKAGQAAKQTAVEIEKVGKAGKQSGHTVSDAFRRTFTAVNAVRIALGALVAMFLFNAIQAVSNFFRSAIEQATKFEDTLYRLKNAERALSMEGVEVTLKGLKKGIVDIQKLLPIFSKEDIASLVGTLAVSTKQLGLNEQQILDLAKAVGILNVRSEKQEDIQTTAQHVLSSLLTGNAKGISALGIAFTDNVMKAKAMELGFLEAGEAVSKLSENEKGITKLNIILESTGQEMEGIGEYLDSNSAKLQQNKAAWSDLLTTVGQLILPFIPLATGFFQLINDGFNGFKVGLIELAAVAAGFQYIWKSIWSGQIWNMNVDEFKQAIEDTRTLMTNEFFKEVPDNAPEWFKKGWGDRIKADAETATDALAAMNDAAADNEEAQNALEELDQKLQEIMLDAKQAQEDLDLKLGQKQSDLDTDYNRKQEDAAIDHAQKLEDINRDALQKIEDAKRKAREEERKAEDDLLQKLKELRERFLLDLEEALHKRDARQVLRLIKEYKLDKQNLLDRKKLDDQERKDSLAADLEAIEIERRRRIESENIEYKRKLSDLAEWKAREQEELALWYKREQEDIQRNIEQKIQRLLAGYIAEEKLHAEHQAAIAEILAKYIGYDMEMINNLAQFMTDRFAQIGAMAAQIGSLNANYGFSNQTNPFSGQYQLPQSAENSLTLAGATGSGGSSGGNSSPPPPRRRAEGGSFLATRPTMMEFGERGPELATFTPINRTGLDAGKLFGDASGSGFNGTIMVAVDLSPDLEGRVVQRSMDGVAKVISRVNNRKV